MAEEQNGNGRLLARLDERTEYIVKRMDVLDKHDERLNNLEKDVSSVKTWQTLIGSGNGILAVLAMIFGINKQ